MRTEGWERRLSETVQSKFKTPFEWGEHDCSLFALDCLDAQCETDLVSSWRGTYKTARGAYGALQRKGGYQGVAESYGLIKKPISEAQRGDIAFIGGDLALGVVMGDSIISTGERGLVSLPINRALYVWGMPCHQ